MVYRKMVNGCQLTDLAFINRLNSEVGYLQLNDNEQSRSGNTETETFEKAGGPVPSIKTYRDLANS